MTAGPLLEDWQRRIILELARNAISIYLETENEISAPPHDFLQKPGAAFVTLKIEDELRGCIGSTEAIHPLGETIVHCAISAAFQDPRFPPLALEEFDRIHLEVSVLTPMRIVTDPEEIQVGIHGIYLTVGNFRGLLLPQVAVEYGWDRETFLKYTCQKAGLPPEAWKLPGAKIQIFSAEVFGEDK
jgi:AmmeMemoRadiSam system protein A